MNKTKAENNEVNSREYKERQRNVFFISKDGSWQRYRYDIFKKLAHEFHVKFIILTTGSVRAYLKSDSHPWSGMFEGITLNNHIIIIENVSKIRLKLVVSGWYSTGQL